MIKREEIIKKIRSDVCDVALAFVDLDKMKKWDLIKFYEDQRRKGNSKRRCENCGFKFYPLQIFRSNKTGLMVCGGCRDKLDYGKRKDYAARF